MRRPEYVPRGYTYVSAHAGKTRTRFRRGARIGSPWVRVVMVIVGLIAVAVAAVALWRIGQLHDQERAGWPVVVVTPSPMPQPAACHALGRGCS